MTLIGDIQGKTVLDAGCGEGRSTRHLALQGGQLTGVDISKAMIDKAIEKNVTQQHQADFVMAFYNPISTQRRWQLDRTKELLLQFRSATTPVVLARNVGRLGELIRVITLGELNADDADMRTMIIVGSSQTRILERSGYDLPWVYTPRRYQTE